MNLIDGRIMNDEEGRVFLKGLPESINRTLQGEYLDTDKVIEACDALADMLNETQHLPLLMSLGLDREKALEELALVKRMMSRDYLLKRIEIELGTNRNDTSIKVSDDRRTVIQGWRPLGVLMHIAAGNVDALPVFSVIEGLLTGNINILKLPGTDDGLSVMILQELMETYPMIRQYVYVFDFPSSDIVSMQKMADCSDALIVWGGDEAVKAVRTMAGPDTRIIEWGHKISFAYVTGHPDDDKLEGLAYNICDTEQLFCNSCQGIFVDTQDFGTVCDFAERFSSVLEKVSMDYGKKKDPFLTAKQTIELRVEELEAADDSKVVYKGIGTSVIAFDDRKLLPSYMFRNCWVKPLSEDEIIEVLHEHKNHLQTAALICDDDDRGRLEEKLFRAGVTRVTDGRNMSTSYCGQPHDGEFPLRRYMKRVSIEY